MKEENNNVKTMFKYQREVEKYIDIIGGKKLNKSGKYKIDCLGFNSIDTTINGKKYVGIYCADLPCVLYKYFEDYGLNGTFTYMDGGIYGLEPLVLSHVAMMNYNAADKRKTIEENYNYILNDVRKRMLENVYLNSTDDLELSLTPFDKAVAVFLQEDFDVDDFLDKCIFNTTGYYEHLYNDNYGACISFSWYTKDDPDTIYTIDMTEKGYISSIKHKNPENRFYQAVEHKHVIGKNEDTFIYRTPVFSTHMEFDINRIYHTVKYTVKGHTTESRKITDQDIKTMNAIMDSFIDKDLSFDEIKSLKREYPRNNFRR